MSRFIQLFASSRLPRMEALAAARAALDRAGACVTAISHYADKASVLNIELRPAAVQDITATLRESGMFVDEASLTALKLLAVDGHGDAIGTLQILYTGNEPERFDPIPAVPG